MKPDASDTARMRITVICPVYNEEKTIPIFYERFNAAVASLRSSYDVELIFTNNRSTDRSLDVIKTLRAIDSTVQVITLSRNFGYQASLQAGLSQATGEAVMFIDVDCEDPPELIPLFVEKWAEGYDIVYGERGDRPEGTIIKTLRNYFYHILRAVGDADIVLYMAEFAIFSQKVREAIVNNQNTFPYIRAEIGYAGFSRHAVRYNRQIRVSGLTHYNIIDMFTIAVGALLTSSTFPMRAAALSFPILALINVVLLVLDGSSDVGPWFKILVALDLMFLMLLATTYGLYIARIHKNLMGRPIFIIDRDLTILNNGQNQDRS